MVLVDVKMRLLSTSSTQQASELQLVEFNPSEIPPYAILSHTWGRGEVLYNDVINGTAPQREAFQKVHDACLQARADGYDYIWIDTCCINKVSSAELSEAINSMFAWYRDSNICYAFLNDLADDDHESFAECRWWTRGWTLQELIAPGNVIFFDRNWTKVGDKSTLGKQIAKITRISEDILTGKRSMGTASIANRMGWAARRTTTRPEDMAYCLMGIFSVNMPLLYGEGMRAFIRLQEEIMKYSTDQTLFAWVDKDAPDDKEYGLLAPSPQCFETTHLAISYDPQGKAAPYTMTNEGISIQMLLRKAEQIVHNNAHYQMYNGLLSCPPPSFVDATFLCVYLVKNGTSEDGYARIRASRLGEVPILITTDLTASESVLDKTADIISQRRQIYVRPRPESQRPEIDSLYPWHFINLAGRPPDSQYELLAMYRMTNVGTQRIQYLFRWDSDSIVVRRGPDKVSLMVIWRRVSDKRLLVVAIGNLDPVRLAFCAEEICAGPDWIAPLPESDITQENGKVWTRPISLSSWMEMQDRFRPTPMGETLRLPRHEVKISTQNSMKQSARYYQLSFDIRPVVDSVAPSEASTLGSRKGKGRIKQLISSLK